MKRDVFRVAGDRCVLREQFRSAQEVQDRGYVIMGSGITFPGNGVRFTRTAGQRLVLPQTPSRGLLLTAFSAHCCFTPAWDVNEAAANSYAFWEQDANIGYMSMALWANLFAFSAPGDIYKVSATTAATVAAWRQYEKNYISYSITNGNQKAWLNGVQIGSSSVSPMPAATSNVARALNIGSNGSGAGYGSVFNGTIHEIAWYDTTMTLEEHLDLMQADTYSEVWS